MGITTASLNEMSCVQLQKELNIAHSTNEAMAYQEGHIEETV
jgi:hypothetical protein